MPRLSTTNYAIAPLTHVTGLDASGNVKHGHQSVQNVKDHGAVGDGVANDTAAIQAAVNAAGRHGAVLFPVGTYLINATVTLKFGQRIMGTGGNGAAFGPTITNSNNAVWAFDLETSAGAQTDTNVGPTLNGLRIVSDYGVKVGVDNETVDYYINNASISGCWFEAQTTAAGATAIWLIENYRGHVQDTTIISYGLGVRLKSCDVCRVQSSRVMSCATGIKIESPSSTGTQTWIVHNDLLGGRTTAPGYMIDSEDRWLVVENNYFEGVGVATQQQALVKTRGGDNWVNSLVFRDNRIEYDTAQASYVLDVFDGPPITLHYANNFSNKASVVSNSRWPAKLYQRVEGLQRRIYWDDQLGNPPFATLTDQNMGFNGSWIISPAVVGGNSGPNAASLYIAENAFCLDHAGTSLELFADGRYKDVAAGSQKWRIQVIAKGSAAGVQAWFQARNGLGGFVDHIVFTLTTDYQLYEYNAAGVTRTDLRMWYGTEGATTGTVFISKIILTLMV